MLYRDFVKLARDAALEKRKCRLRGVRVNVALYVNSISVADRAVLRTVNSARDECWN
jgi:hypothetical protein